MIYRKGKHTTEAGFLLAFLVIGSALAWKYGPCIAPALREIGTPIFGYVGFRTWYKRKYPGPAAEPQPQPEPPQVDIPKLAAEVVTFLRSSRRQ